MGTYISDAIQIGLNAARDKARKKTTRLRVETENGYYRVLEMWETGFAISLRDAPNLRGFVDLYDGPQHMFQCLVIACDPQGDQMIYEFKRATFVADQQPQDFAADAPQPRALIEPPRL